MRRAFLLAAPLLAIALLLAVEFAPVRATNFGGYDEWFLIDLVDKWIVGIPYTNRPLHYLWALPARVLMPHQLAGFLWVHCFWLLATGWLVYALVRLLVPRDRPLALLAGAFAAVWTASDPVRINSYIGLVGYAAPTAATLAALLCFLEAFRRRSLAFLALAGTIAAVTARAFEGVLPMLALAPLLLLWTRPARVSRWWLLAWESLAAVLVLLVLLPRLTGRAAESYQLSGLGLDLVPWRVAWRLGWQFAFQLSPVLTTPGYELAAAAGGAVLAMVVFAAAFLYLRRGSDGAAEEKLVLVRLALLGAVMAALGFSVFVLSSAIVGPARVEFLSTPGIALLLAAAVRLVSSARPGRAGRAVELALACWVIAVGVARTTEMQFEASLASYWPRQNGTLVQLTDCAPGLRPNTLVVLIDEAHAWPAGFTFRHAVSLVYDPPVRAVVWGALPVYYPWRFTPEGALLTPWPMLQQAWHSPASFHRYDEMAVFRLRPDGTLRLEETWPSELPPLPRGAVYAPRRLIVPDAPTPPARAILRRS